MNAGGWKSKTMTAMEQQKQPKEDWLDNLTQDIRHKTWASDRSTEGET